MRERISEERVKELANLGHTKFYNGLSIPLPEVESMARELLALRAAAEGMEKALEGFQQCSSCMHDRLAHCNLSGDRWECSTCTCVEFNEPDVKHDVATEALAAYRKAVGK